MTGDTRSFVYPLEVLRLQAAWRLDGLQRELATASRRLAAKTEELRVLDLEHAALCADAAPSAMATFDPARARRLLEYLAGVRRRIYGLQQDLASMQASRDALARECRMRRLELDAIERHRGESLAEHVAEAVHRQAVEADQEWLARIHWRERHRIEMASHLGEPLR